VLCPSCGKLVGVSDEVCYNCGRKNPGLWGFAGPLSRLGVDFGFDQAVIGGTLLLYLATLVATGTLQGSGLNILSPSPEVLLRFGASGGLPVFGLGRWWTVLSAGWLHAGLLHILFNSLWIRQLAPQTAGLYGPGRMVILYTISSITGFLLSSVANTFLFYNPMHLTVGASAPLFGLFGAMVGYGRKTGSSTVGREGWTYALVLFVFGFVFGGVDNWAHAGGFLGGFLGSLWLDPRRDERAGHRLLALTCLVLTLLSVVASLVIPPFR
jgi:rhomboid protease GluP